MRPKSVENVENGVRLDRILLASIHLASHPSGLDSSCKQPFILYFCILIFNDLYPAMIFEFYKVTNMGEEPVHYLSIATCWIKIDSQTCR